MTALYIAQPGANIYKRGERLEVVFRHQKVLSIPIHEVERVVLLGPVQISAPAVRALLRATIPVVFCSVRGRFYGALTTGWNDTQLRITQLDRYRDSAFRLETARAIVSVKIRHQRALLRRYVRRYSEPPVARAADQLTSLLETLSNQATVEGIMGIEGRASAVYFSVLGRCIRQDGIEFRGRNRRPPRDPVNALLSLGYMLVMAEAMGTLMAQGLDPGIGFLHEVSPRRPALALDILELARQPIVDRLVLSLINLNMLTPQDFETHGDGSVVLHKESLRKFLYLYERAMNATFRDGGGESGTFRTWLRQWAGTLKRAIWQGVPWRPPPLPV